MTLNRYRLFSDIGIILHIIITIEHTHNMTLEIITISDY